MEQTATPRERVIFDDSVYDEDLLRELLEDRYVINGDMPELNDDFVDENWYQLDEYRQQDYEDETTALADYLHGEASAMSSAVSESAGNPLIVSGSIGRWDGTRTGFSVFKDLRDVLDGPDSPFKDCEIQKVWDENGQLFIHGAHHDGSVTVEVRQLSDAGAEAYSTIDETYSFETGPFTALGKSYDGSDASVIEAMHDLWDATEPPRYMERAFGCPAVEWQAPEAPLPLKDLTVGHWRVHMVMPSEVLGLPPVESTEYDLDPGRYAGMARVQVFDLASGDDRRLVGQFQLGSLVNPLDPKAPSISERVSRGLSLDLGKGQLISGDDLAALARWADGSYWSLGGKQPAHEDTEPHVSLKDEARASREAADALAGNDGHDDHVQDAR